MTTLVIGATGATGKLLVQQLIARELEVKALVRYPEKVAEAWKNHKNLSLVKSSIAEISEHEMAQYLSDCEAVLSCLGHNITLKGIYGKPRKLVTDAVQLITRSVIKHLENHPIKFVLMNTAGNRNRGINEHISFAEKALTGFLRWTLPPHADNEDAAEYLRSAIGQNESAIDWVVVRPDSLVDEEQVSPYSVHPSPVRSAIFNPGKTSRINVADFMAELITNQELWHKWQGQMPVIYNDRSQ